MTAQIKMDTPPVAKPLPAVASVKAEPVPQAVKSEEGKEFLYATKVMPVIVLLALMKNVLLLDDGCEVSMVIQGA